MFKIFPKLKKQQKIDDSLVKKLYGLSVISLPVLLIFSFLVTLALYPMLKISIIIWFCVLAILIIYRLYSAYIFRKNPESYSTKYLYRYFVILALITGLVFSSLGFIFINNVGDYYKIFILSALVGVSLGATSSLASDVRLNIVYISIMLVPLFITLVFSIDMPIHWILAISILLYYLAQINSIYKMFTQSEELNKLESKQGILHTLFIDAPIGMFTFDENYTILSANKELGKVFHNDIKNIIGMNLMKLPDSRSKDMFTKALEVGSSCYTGPYISLFGEKFWMDVKLFSYQDIHTDKIGIAMIEDKTKEHTALEKLEYLVEHDTLTGLLNRRGFSDYIEKLVSDTRHATYYSILFYLDLNQFKSINDSLGHAVGDKVLLLVSERLRNTLDEKCIISRLGGDEFLIMVPYISTDYDEVKQVSKKYSNYIEHVFSDSFVVNEMPLYIKSSIGILIVEPKFTDTEEILRHADLTMYQAKKSNTHISYYDASLDKKQKELFTLQHDLAHAIIQDELQLFYQPIVKMKDETLHSAELLIRWEHPVRGVLSPEEFVPLAMKVGLLSKITWWLLKKLCQQIAQWKKEGQWKLKYISININPKQLLENHFAKDFFKILKSYDIKTNEIVIELTERTLIDNFSNTQGVINDLKSHGVKCAIDDFGTGYSSLSYLKKLSFHMLKIDRTFVKDIGQSPKELILVKTILDIGRQFDYQIIIEGVENDQQKQALLVLDEDLYYQGYFYSRPSKAKEFTNKFLN
jgi:diguanylate cyclase (GGDEF)-like protein